MATWAEHTTGPLTTSATDANAVNQVQTINLSAGASADTFKLTFNGHESSGAVTLPSGGYANTTAAQVKTCLLTISDWTTKTADIAVVKASNAYAVTFTGTLGGIKLGAITVTSKTGTADGSVAQTTAGRSAKTVTLPVGVNLVSLGRVRAGLFEDGSTNDLIITDALGRTVMSFTGKDFNVSGVLYDQFVGYDGLDQAGNAAADTQKKIFVSPFTVKVKTDAAATGSVVLFTKGNRPKSDAPVYRKRSTGTFTLSTGGGYTATVGLKETISVVRGFSMVGFDSSTDVVVVDAYGKGVFSKTALDGTTLYDTALGADGIDQSGNAAADVLPTVAKSPLTVTIANGGNRTSGYVYFYVEP